MAARSRWFRLLTQLPPMRRSCSRSMTARGPAMAHTRRSGCRSLENERRWTVCSGATEAADIGGLCPLAETGVAVSRDPLWKLLTGMCGAMAGDDLTAASVFDRLKGSDTLEPFDLQLAERVATLSGGGGRAANIEWETAPRLTPYRFGVAVAAGVRVPLPRLAGMPPGWVLRAPVGDAARLAAVRPAAALGIASAQELVSTVAAVGGDDEELAVSGAARLRTA